MKLILPISVAFLLIGCAGVYRPKPAVPESLFSAPYLSDLESKTFWSDYNALPDGPAKVARRNTVLYELVHLTDVQYNTYEAGFFAGQAYLGTASDFAELGLDAAGASIGTAALKSILASVGSGITGANASFQKNFFDQQTRTAIVEVMRSNRLSQLAIIEQGMVACSAVTVCSTTGSIYTLQQGFLDIEAYYNAGTVIGALESINQSSSQQTRNARRSINTSRGLPQTER